MLAGMARTISERGGGSAADSMHKAYGMLQNTLFRQAAMLAYIDCFWILGVAILAMVPLAFLMKRPPTGGEVPVH